MKKKRFIRIAVLGVAIGIFLLSTPAAWGQGFGGGYGGSLMFPGGGSWGLMLPQNPCSIDPNFCRTITVPLERYRQWSPPKTKSKRLPDLRDAGRIISGCVIKDGVKYTADGGLENLTEQEVQLDTGKEHIILGPNTVLDGEGNLLRGYVIVGGQGIF